MVRIEVATIVWSSAARNMPAIRPDRIVMICRWLISPDAAFAGAGWVVMRAAPREAVG